MKTPLCSVAEIPPDSAIKVDFFGREALVYLVDGRPRAIANVCTHIGGPLAQQGERFICAWHGAMFSCRDGRKLSGPGRHHARLMTIPTRVEGGTLFYVESVDATLTAEDQAAALAAAERDGRLYWLLGRLGVMRLFGARLAAGTSPGAAALDPETATLLMLHASRSKDIAAMLAESAAMTADDGRLRAARPLGALPVVVLAADSSLQDAGWRAAQDIQATLSSNSQLVVVPQSSHFIALDQPQVVADAIADVLASVRTGRPLVP